MVAFSSKRASLLLKNVAVRFMELGYEAQGFERVTHSQCLQKDARI
jgi:hypothetical protein